MAKGQGRSWSQGVKLLSIRDCLQPHYITEPELAPWELRFQVDGMPYY